MTDEELQSLGAKAAAMPDGRNELSPKPLCAVTAQAVVDPEGRIRVYNSETGEVVTIRQVDGAAIAAANDIAGLKAALQTVLSEAGIAAFD
ncbi:hypothetical protein [Ruficoccus sp. ZRK36]|uniref:hypothetical protein n=1 Tax=Ruficoccus sp. ZRK36 TaxID=2866311 RepID=UPI001C73B545|nr:hypothetical protein [Ruficoccus sp. ZRK36]QYY34604.1 hypothetical protein K0V07_09845 [Ruficoccus sp. ZRK36]